MSDNLTQYLYDLRSRKKKQSESLCAHPSSQNHQEKAAKELSELQGPDGTAAQMDAMALKGILKAELGCPVCCEPVRCPHIIGCGHMACGNCLIKWFKKHSRKEAHTCPSCQAKVDNRPLMVEGLSKISALLHKAGGRCKGKRTWNLTKDWDRLFLENQ
ncbi:hypothetical protein BDN71DRAFT_1431895 [Pleurotus eryngii]|uniref:RING-type domain-containing protein n=1 Tax=Pleurotus eryngii TaxID=5323 RepID=A0A9P5ZX22_PLEER|nr:hypothetical protein BDN71DRAFT_1431895 [Pleurotus eryngii]